MAEPLTYYTLMKHEKHAPKDGEFYLETAALMNCALCGLTISGMGGGGTYICSDCGKMVIRGDAVGAIVREPLK